MKTETGGMAILAWLFSIALVFAVGGWLMMLASDIFMGAFDRPGFGFWASGTLCILLDVILDLRKAGSN